MTQPIPSMRLLEDCEPHDLIRINWSGRTEWAIVGARNAQMFLICVLSGANAPFLLDAAGFVGVKQEFEYPVLSYGRAYALKPDQAGPCDVNSGPLFGVHGTMIQSDLSSESRLFLCCTFAERSAGKAYYNIGSGHTSVEPGGMKASYGRWALRLDKAITETEEPVAVVQFAAGVTAPPGEAT
jgi:hypothetical protein